MGSRPECCKIDEQKLDTCCKIEHRPAVGELAPNSLADFFSASVPPVEKCRRVSPKPACRSRRDRPTPPGIIAPLFVEYFPAAHALSRLAQVNQHEAACLHLERRDSCCALALAVVWGSLLLLAGLAASIEPAPGSGPGVAEVLGGRWHEHRRGGDCLHQSPDPPGLDGQRRGPFRTRDGERVDSPPVSGSVRPHSFGR